jgi:ABC-type glycerol-3-phosphate transport system substrate-binding protein
MAYQNKVTAAVRAGSGMPDVFAVESAFVKRFVNMNGCLADLSSYDTAAATKDMIPYTVDIGKDAGGKIRALSWQACPGAVGYKRDLAKKYLGTDDPAKITEMLSTPEKILETGETVKKASGGKVKLFVGLEDLYKIYAGSRTQPWVVDGKFTIDQKMVDFLDLAKKMRDGKMDGGIKQWTPGWSAAITDDVHMCWAIPTWGVQWIVAVNAKDQADKGRWGLATPIGYSEGGTWIGMSPQCKDKELAWEFIKFLTSNTDYLMKRAETSGDFFNNKQVIDAFSKKTDYINKTVNQNTYAVYGPLADKVNGSLFTQYDDQIKLAYQDLLATYLAGKIDKDTMIKKLKEKIKTDMPDIKVE